MAYGLEIYGPNQELWLGVTDNLVVFYELVIGTYSGTQTDFVLTNQTIPVSADVIGFEIVNGTMTTKYAEVTYVYPTGRVLRVTSAQPLPSQTVTYAVMGGVAL